MPIALDSIGGCKSPILTRPDESGGLYTVQENAEETCENVRTEPFFDCWNKIGPVGGSSPEGHCTQLVPGTLVQLFAIWALCKCKIAKSSKPSLFQSKNFAPSS